VLEDAAFVLSIILLGAAGSVLIKILAAHTKSESFQAFAALT
jgi:hypothetical protein